MRALGVAGEFARDADWCAAGDEVEDTGGDELVCEDEVCGQDCFVGCAGEEVGVAGAGAGEDDAALFGLQGGAESEGVAFERGGGGGWVGGVRA